MRHPNPQFHAIPPPHYHSNDGWWRFPVIVKMSKASSFITSWTNGVKTEHLIRIHSTNHDYLHDLSRCTLQCIHSGVIKKWIYSCDTRMYSSKMRAWMQIWKSCSFVHISHHHLSHLPFAHYVACHYLFADWTNRGARRMPLVYYACYLLSRVLLGFSPS